MARRPPPPVPADSPDEVEARFYEALQQGTLERLMALWADDDEIVCVHPGGARVVGAAAIRASFEAVFARGGIPVRPEQVHRLQQPGFALHHLVERIEVTAEGGTQVGWVLATNVYVKGPLGWRIAAHHASGAMPHDITATDADGPITLH
ncbi:MAG: nuclear transport factor 2 family protein [Betaproteobacteria bacterium]|nr:nuclear transport factor 2 family protein [Betaproteobacteria bacterium]